MRTSYNRLFIYFFIFFSFKFLEFLKKKKINKLFFSWCVVQKEEPNFFFGSLFYGPKIRAFIPINIYVDNLTFIKNNLKKGIIVKESDNIGEHK